MCGVVMNPLPKAHRSAAAMRLHRTFPTSRTASRLPSFTTTRLDELKDENFKKAAKGFGEVERQHPYSQWATRAILMQAYAHYQRNDYDSAQNAAQRFITLHPGHRDAPYAYYLVAISHYEQISDVRRDQSETEKALRSLEEISQRFPGTSYARDAEAKAVLARDHLAGKEMEIGRYYLNKRAHTASINRFKKVVQNYQTTTHTPEALYRLTEAYLALGIRSEAQTAAAVLGHNYPNSDWYRDAYSLLERGRGCRRWKTRARGSRRLLPASIRFSSQLTRVAGMEGNVTVFGAA